MKSFLSKIHPVDDAVMAAYISEWKEYRVPRRTIMTAPGDTQRHIYFVLDGIQKSYYINDGKKHIMAFTYPPSFSGIPESFLTQTPSKYFLESITDSIFLRLSYERHEQLMAEHRALETLFRKATELLLVGIAERHYELMAFDIKTRFLAFAQRSAHLLNVVSHKDLASYLRIDPTNFSKLVNSVEI